MTPTDRAHVNRRALERPDPGSFKTSPPFGYDRPILYTSAANVVPVRPAPPQPSGQRKD